MRARRPPSLAGHYTLLIGAAFVAFALLIAVLVVSLLMAPMARRAADDLAGLMVLSAQTWRELPPPTRVDFEQELRAAHAMELVPGRRALANAPHRHGLYLMFLEEALGARLGRPLQFDMESRPDGTWAWANIPVGDGWIAIGIPHARVQTRPLWAIGLTLALALALAGLTAMWLARRIAAPLARLEQAMDVVGRGATPSPVPETGPREIAAVGRHFNRTAAQVRELLAARTTLFAGLSHDLRTPLARLRLAAELYATRRDPALLERIEAEVNHLDRLIGELLALSRGMEQEPAREVDLAALFDELAAQAVAAGARARAAATCGRVSAAPTALRRVLANLVENAVRHGGAEVELRSRRDDDGATVIEVLDRGPGVPAELLETVFQPFQRVEGSRSPATGGSGLGLAIVRQLCQANGWTAGLVNREGGGLIAQIRLPAAGA